MWVLNPQSPLIKVFAGKAKTYNLRDCRNKESSHDYIYASVTAIIFCSRTLSNTKIPTTFKCAL